MNKADHFIADLISIHGSVKAAERLSWARYLTFPEAAKEVARVKAAMARVAGIWGEGTLMYLTDEGYAGVQLDGETRVDEYPLAYLTLAL